MALADNVPDCKPAHRVGGIYRKNPVGGFQSSTGYRLQKLCKSYHLKCEKDVDRIALFYFRFMDIKPFSAFNGIVGRILMFRECLRNGILPFVDYGESSIFSNELLMETYRKGNRRMVGEAEKVFATKTNGGQNG